MGSKTEFTDQKWSVKNTMLPHEAIDAIYQEARNAVDNEISQVDDLFLFQAAKEGRSADEIELTNLLYE